MNILWNEVTISWNEVTISWNEVTIFWNEVTVRWNEMTWNEVTIWNEVTVIQKEYIIFTLLRSIVSNASCLKRSRRSLFDSDHEATPPDPVFPPARF